MQLERYDNSWYKPGPAYKIVLWSLTKAVFFNHSLALFSGWKCFLLRLFGAKIGTGVVIKPSVNIKYPWFLAVGNNVWIGEDAWLDNLGDVAIGNNVCISQGAFLLTGNHNYKKQTFDLVVRPIRLEDGVWIGAKSIVCPGVTCSTHSVLTVGSVATRDMESFGVYSGNPAEKVKERIVESN